jgi:RNA polymerase sigma factor (sigma-70 family)
MQVAQLYSDTELIMYLKHPQKMNDALRFMYKEYYGLLESYIVNNNGSKDDAADLIQETMVTFIDIVQQNKFRGDASIKSFLYSIIRNFWMSEMRKRNSTDKRNRIFEKAKDETEQAAVTQLIRNEQLAAIQKLFEKLGEKCKQLLLLVYYEDLSMSDIVSRMPEYQSEQVLRNKKYKCMKQLNEMINGSDELRKQLKNALRNAG